MAHRSRTLFPGIRCHPTIYILASATIRFVAPNHKKQYSLEFTTGGFRYTGAGFEVELDSLGSPESARGSAKSEVDLTWAYVMREFHEALLVNGGSTWIRELASS